MPHVRGDMKVKKPGASTQAPPKEGKRHPSSSWVTRMSLLGHLRRLGHTCMLVVGVTNWCGKTMLPQFPGLTGG